MHNHFVIQFNKPDQQLLIDRLLFVQALETVRCYEEGVIQSFDKQTLEASMVGGFQHLEEERFNLSMIMGW